MNFRATKANLGLEKLLETFTPKPEILALYSKILQDKFEHETENINTLTKNISREIEQLEKQIKFIQDRWISGFLVDEKYKSITDDLEEKKSKLILERANLKQMPTEYEKYIEYGCTLIGNVAQYYKDAPVHTKKRMLGSIFPEKLVFENDMYRTNKTNAFFGLLSNSINTYKKRKADSFVGLSTLAPSTGLEPVTL